MKQIFRLTFLVCILCANTYATSPIYPETISMNSSDLKNSGLELQSIKIENRTVNILFTEKFKSCPIAYAHISINDANNNLIYSSKIAYEKWGYGFSLDKKLINNTTITIGCKTDNNQKAVEYSINMADLINAK